MLAFRIDAMMLIVLHNLVEAADAKVELSNTFLLQCLEEETRVSHREIILLFLLCLQIGDHFSLLLFTSKLAHLKHILIDISAAMCANDEDPVASSSFKAVHLVLVLQNA